MEQVKSLRANGSVGIIGPIEFIYNSVRLDVSLNENVLLRGHVMEYGAELARLEEFVDKLLSKYNQLKSETHALQEALHQRDTECADLKKQVVALSTERTEVGNKVSGLLDRIEQWENDQMAASAPLEEEHDDSQGSLFRNGPEMKTY